MDRPVYIISAISFLAAAILGLSACAPPAEVADTERAARIAAEEKARDMKRLSEIERLVGMSAEGVEPEIADLNREAAELRLKYGQVAECAAAMGRYAAGMEIAGAFEHADAARLREFDLWIAAGDKLEAAKCMYRRAKLLDREGAASCGYAEAGEAYQRGDRALSMPSFSMAGEYREPDGCPEAAEAYKTVAALAGEAGYLRLRLDALCERARLLAEEKGPRRWLVADVYFDAAGTAKALGIRENVAYCLHQYAFNIDPERNPFGEWPIADEYYAESIRKREGAGNEGDTAVSWGNRGYMATRTGNPAMSYEVAAAYFKKAAEVATGAKRHAEHARYLIEWAYYSGPPVNEKASWETGVETLRAAVEAGTHCGDDDVLARAYYWLGRFLVEDDREKVAATPEAYKCFRKAYNIWKNLKRHKEARAAMSWWGGD